MQATDPDCIFCKIVRGEIPSRKIYEDDDVLAFHDIQPIAPVHFMLVPKTHIATLEVEVDAAEIRARFGVGIIRKSIALADVVRCDLVRTPMRWGWGIHWTPSGWLYNVGGRVAVRLEMKSQRPLMIGSNDAQQLKAAIDARLEGRGN